MGESTTLTLTLYDDKKFICQIFGQITHLNIFLFGDQYDGSIFCEQEMVTILCKGTSW